MDKYDVMSMLGDLFIGLSTEEEIEARANEIINLVDNVKKMAKEYLKTGIL